MINLIQRRTAAITRGPGLGLAAGVAIVATLLAKIVPVIGTPVICIIIGVAIAAVHKPGPRFRPGLVISSRLVLQIAVVVLGSQISLGQVIRVGLSSLPVMLGTLSACLLGAYWIGRWLNITGDLRTLIGVGTGICGASAIAAVTPIIGAASADVAYAIPTIFLFNMTAVLTFPFVGHLLGMSQHSFGLFAGTAVNDMSSVVAASTIYGSAAANYAIVVKLTRTLLIIPISLALAASVRRRSNLLSPLATANKIQHSEEPLKFHVRIRGLVPWYLIGFLLVAEANSVGLIPSRAHHALVQSSIFLIAIALSAIGLSTDLSALRRTGHRPLILGAALWVLVSVASILLQLATRSL